MTTDLTAFEHFLNEHDDESWSATLTTVLRSIHEVDKNATQIWFAFYPISLFNALKHADDPEKLARQLLLLGSYYLKDQIDSSHQFLYGHRYWPEVKSAVQKHAASFSEANAPSLSDQIVAVAALVTRQLKLDQSLINGITAVGFMTVQQVGVAAFNTPGKMLLDKKHARKSPAQVLSERAKDDSQGLLGFLRTVNKKWTV